jgi:hypothetical protein
MHSSNIIFGILNISCGILFTLISIPLVAKKVPMNKLYGFRIAKSFVSDENWYTINWYGGKQLIKWSILLIFIGILYFIFPVKELPSETQNAFLAVAPIIICVAIAIVKTIVFSRRL